MHVSCVARGVGAMLVRFLFFTFVFYRSEVNSLEYSSVVALSSMAQVSLASSCYGQSLFIFIYVMIAIP